MREVLLIPIGLVIGAVCDVFRRMPNRRITKGEVIYLQRKYSDEPGNPLYKACVEYSVNGTVYTIMSRYASSTFRTGQIIRVVYNGENPAKAYLKPGLVSYLLTYGCIAAGIGFILKALLETHGLM